MRMQMRMRMSASSLFAPFPELLLDLDSLFILLSPSLLLLPLISPLLLLEACSLEDNPVMIASLPPQLIPVIMKQ